ncbi:imidazole glycerol phosphate synthase subunit HisH [Marinihelvus fidelis]|uniref:Imidazole glycerol phosphate synthase subunit HisH n=1 Tax=Marinihelvus fidelis TaxID=2613842 RepID=A0A5N0T8N8_9GAMM|nr:imidazole glycerol phosphate synthase subunit HisH [Marinihelvus fidelis]KAA9131385.1 imidazole glycerol phosphate synthase subunit HisH [Marinihelvus fidelis]
MSLAIIDSGGANIASVMFALRRLGAEPVFTADAEVIRRADRVILPGVGAAGAAMARLREHGLVDTIRALTQPVLGICLGMQLLYESSSEGDTDCLGLVPGRLERLPAAPDRRVPHMGWSRTTVVNNDGLLAGLDSAPWFYFVHSYAAPVNDCTVATGQHGPAFTAITRRGNFRGAQFHPERSAAAGSKLLKNFLQMT